MEGAQRFNWINGFLTASIQVVLEDLEIEISPTTSFKAVNKQYVETLVSRLEQIQTLPNVEPLPEGRLDYLFHLESELWGNDCEYYLNFFPDEDSPPHIVLQTFLFTHAFFLLERWLNLFLPPNKWEASRKSRRRILFGKDDGVFTVKHRQCLTVLGLPFNLLSSTTRVEPIEPNRSNWERLRDVTVPGNLRKFYLAVCEKDHFVDIIESSFINSRTKLRGHLLNRRQLEEQRRVPGLRASWYDILWIYSESIRYHSLSPSNFILENPFHWNRSVRWYMSLIISGLMCIVHKANNQAGIASSWSEAIQNNTILKSVLSDSRDPIFLQDSSSLIVDS